MECNGLQVCYINNDCREDKNSDIDQTHDSLNYAHMHMYFELSTSNFYKTTFSLCNKARLC